MKDPSDLLAFVFGAASVVALGVDGGGFYPRAWEWGSLAALLIVAAGVVHRRGLRLAGDEWKTLVALAALAAWIAATVVLTANAPTLGVPELERAGLYIALFWAALMLPRDRSPWALQLGILAGTVVVCAVGLIEFLFPATSGVPDTFEGRNLFQPVGYANAFGILAGIGALLALGLAAGSDSRIARASGAAALVPVLTALFLTSSRGAVVATIIGFVAMLGLEPEPRRLLVIVAKTLPLPVLGLLVAAHSRVRSSHVPMTLVARDGHIVAVTIPALTLAAGLVALHSLSGGRAERGSRHSLLIAGGGVAAVALLFALGGVHGALGDRPHYWDAAWIDFIHHPWLGSGAGTFGSAWLHYRSVGTAVQDAHNLYLETLAELGPVGLTLLLVSLALPLRRVRVARAWTPSVGPVLGAYVAFLAHSAVDWDWEMPVVTVAALLCGASLLHARQPQAPATVGRNRVATVAAAMAICIALLVLNFIALVGSISLHQAEGSLQSRAWTRAERSARAATQWQPWSAEPYDLLGQAQLARGQRKAAARSFRHALRLDDGRWQTWYELGRISTGPERRVALEHILALNPRAVLERQR
jgi:hypothetical protein